MTVDTVHAGVRQVEAAEWAPTLAALHGRGLVMLDLLTGIDRVEALGAVEVVARVVDPSTAAAETVTTLVPTDPADAAVLASVATVYPAAAWHERETAEMFGVRFDGHPDPRPLLLAGHTAGPPPLRRSTPLPERLSTPWPGAAGPTARGRRRAMPPGVPAAWREDGDG